MLSDIKLSLRAEKVGEFCCHQIHDSLGCLRETIKNRTLLNLVVVLHTVWQFGSPPFQTGSLGLPWKQESCASAQLCSAALCALSLCSSSAAVGPWHGAAVAVAVPAQDRTRLRAARGRAGGTGSSGGSAARGEARAAYPGAWHRREHREPLGRGCECTEHGHSRHPLGTANIQRCSLGRSVP